MTDNPNLKYWTGDAPIIDDNSVNNFLNNIFFYQIPQNPCVIKLGNLIEMKKGIEDNAFILTFGNKNKEVPASDIEFDSITLTLSQESINQRIRVQNLASVTGDSGEEVIEEEKSLDEEKKTLDEEKKKLLALTEADRELTNEQKESAKKEINSLTTTESLRQLTKNTIKLPAAVVSDISSFLSGIIQPSVPSVPGGSKRSMMSSFSRQFELPMPCHAKKRRSRSKKSRGGRRKKGKHTRKHHK